MNDISRSKDAQSGSQRAKPEEGGSTISDETLHQIAESLQGLQFGTVTIFVQDGVVIQIERTEKRRVRRGERLRRR